MSGYGSSILNSTGSVTGTLLMVNGYIPEVVIISCPLVFIFCSYSLLYHTPACGQGVGAVFYVIVSGLSCRVFCG